MHVNGTGKKTLTKATWEMIKKEYNITDENIDKDLEGPNAILKDHECPICHNNKKRLIYTSESTTSNNNVDTKNAQSFFDTIKNKVKDGLQLNKEFGTHARGNFTVNLITPEFNKSTAKDIDWILTSWNYKPSMQFQMSNNKPMPLWIDFNMTLETNMVLSNQQTLNLFGLN